MDLKSSKGCLDSRQLNRVHKLLNYNKSLNSDPKIEQAIVEVELAKKKSQIGASQ